MKTLKFYSLLLFTTVALSAAAVAQSTLGTVRAFSVIGDVTLRNDQTREVVPLRPGREFTEGFTVRTGTGSSVVLVQSNGSTIELTENSSLTVSEFLQDPYDTAAHGRYANLEADPSNSRTRLRVNYGDVTGEVRRLRPGSSYNVDVPTGSAGIRGTIWRVVVRVDLATGDIQVTVSIPEGAADFTTDDGDVIDLSNGQEIDIEGRLQEGSTEDELILDTFVVGQTRQAAEDTIRQATQRAVAARQSARQQQQQEDPPEDPDAPADPDGPTVDPGDTGDVETPPEGDEQNVVDEFSPGGA